MSSIVIACAEISLLYTHKGGSLVVSVLDSGAEGPGFKSSGVFRGGALGDAPPLA